MKQSTHQASHRQRFIWTESDNKRVFTIQLQTSCPGNRWIRNGEKPPVMDGKELNWRRTKLKSWKGFFARKKGRNWRQKRCESESKCVFVCVCVMEREREREKVERENKSICLCACMCENVNEHESICECVCTSMCERLSMCESMWVCISESFWMWVCVSRCVCECVWVSKHARMRVNVYVCEWECVMHMGVRAWICE